MAVLVTVDLTDFIPVGDPKNNYFMKSFSAATITTGADEWITTGMDTLLAVVGHGLIDTTSGAVDTTNFKLNLAGTGGAAQPGSLGIEAGATEALLHVTVIGTKANH